MEMLMQRYVQQFSATKIVVGNIVFMNHAPVHIGNVLFDSNGKSILLLYPQTQKNKKQMEKVKGSGQNTLAFVE